MRNAQATQLVLGNVDLDHGKVPLGSRSPRAAAHRRHCYCPTFGGHMSAAMTAEHCNALLAQLERLAAHQQRAESLVELFSAVERAHEPTQADVSPRSVTQPDASPRSDGLTLLEEFERYDRLPARPSQQVDRQQVDRASIDDPMLQRRTA